MIRYCGRRFLCHHGFRLFLSSSLPQPTISSAMASMTTLINYDSATETLTEELTNRAFACLRPELYNERRKGE